MIKNDPNVELASDLERDIFLPFGRYLTDEQINEVAGNSNTVTFGRREIIFRQGTRTSHIMFIKSGMVKIYKEGRNNKHIILKIATASDYIGLISIFGSEMHQYSASSIVSSEICFIDSVVFHKILNSNGDFSLRIINYLSKYGLFIFERLMSQSHKQLPGRIADVLLYFSEKIFASTEFELPLTRRELAELAGTTKESFIRTLAEFKNDKIIELDGSNVAIKSMKIIHTLSELG